MALIGEEAEAWETVPCPSSQVIGLGPGLEHRPNRTPKPSQKREDSDPYRSEHTRD